MSTKDHDLPKNAKLMFKGIIFDVYHWKQKLYDGSTAIFEKLKRADTVVVIAITEDKKLLLIEEEQPGRKRGINAVAGKVEAGETIEEAAKREFLEETGYAIDNLKLWYTNIPEHKIIWTVYTFVARTCKKIQKPTPEPGEKIKVKLFSFDEFVEKVITGEIKSVKLRNKIMEAKLNPTKMTEIKKLFFI